MFYRVQENMIIDNADFNYSDECKYTDICTTKEYQEDPLRYTLIDGEIAINPNYEEDKKQKEAERIGMLKLTRGDVFRALLQAKQVTRAQIRAQLEALPEETSEQILTKEMALIDFDEALDFYRGNKLIDTIGFQLGITSEQLDRFFETKDYRELLPIEEETNEENSVVEEET